MKHYLFILVLTLSFCSLNAIGQDELPYAPNTCFVRISQDTSLFSTKPVTNREYIIYLMWLYNARGVDYPESFFNAIPALTKEESSHLNYTSYTPETLFDTIFKLAPAVIKEYMFNPQYLDYPVVGVSWLQAGKYCKWLSDRYNEFKLIKHDYLKLDLLQTNENCFVTEAYLANQYEGIPTKEKENVRVKWKDNLFIPTFRLPTSWEVDSAKKQKSIDTGFIAYKFDTTSFLGLWNKWCINVTNNKLYLTFPFSSEKAIKIAGPSGHWDIGKMNCAELTFDFGHLTENLTVDQIYNKHRQPWMNVDVYAKMEKDSVGDMPYIITSENKFRRVNAVGKFKRTDATEVDSSKLYYFGFTGAIKPKEFVK